MTEVAPLREKLLHGYQVFYRSAGEGPGVVLVHGITSTSATWENVIPSLAERFTVIAPDLLGHGESAKPRGDYSLGAYASGIRDLLLGLGHERATFVGHFARRRRRDAARLPVPRALRAAGVGRQPRARHEVSWLLRAASLPGSELVLPLLVNERVLWAGRAVGRGLARVGLRVHTTRARCYAGTPRCPTARRARRSSTRCGGSSIREASASTRAIGSTSPRTAVPDRLGRARPDHPGRHGRAAHALVPGSRLELFPDAGHFPHLDDPLRFVRVLVDFVETTEPARLDTDRWGELLRSGEEPGGGGS